MKKILQYTMFYFLAMGRVAEGEIGINFPIIKPSSNAIEKKATLG